MQSIAHIISNLTINNLEQIVNRYIDTLRF